MNAEKWPSLFFRIFFFNFDVFAIFLKYYFIWNLKRSYSDESLYEPSRQWPGWQFTGGPKYWCEMKKIKMRWVGLNDFLKISFSSNFWNFFKRSLKIYEPFYIKFPASRCFPKHFLIPKKSISRHWTCSRNFHFWMIFGFHSEYSREISLFILYRLKILWITLRAFPPVTRLMVHWRR